MSEPTAREWHVFPPHFSVHVLDTLLAQSAYRPASTEMDQPGLSLL